LFCVLKYTVIGLRSSGELNVPRVILRNASCWYGHTWNSRKSAYNKDCYGMESMES